MKVIKTSIPELLIIEPKVLKDSRGYFFETFNKKLFEKKVGKVSFIQDNESKSKRGVLRGFHYQTPPFEQSKLVRCVDGKVLDIALDLRTKSKTYGQYEKIILTGENKKQFFIPKGFAHAFLVLSDYAVLNYKVDNFYVPQSEGGIIWNDPFLSINWEVEKTELIISEKDKNLNF